MPSTSIHEKVAKNKKCRNPAITEHNAALSVASNPDKSSISARHSEIHKFRWIVVLSPRKPVKINTNSVESE